MQHARQLIFSFLCICNSLLSAEKVPQNGAQYKPNKQASVDMQDVPNIVNDFIKNEQLNQLIPPVDWSLVFDQMDIEEMELIFQSSPKKAQFIVNHLQDPTFFPLGKNYRSALFVGEPGSGKTTMAKAIAYKLSEDGWECKFLSSTSLLGEYRNQTAIRLQKELEAIAASNKPTILIIDELNRLLENADSKHHDTDTTSTVLWTFLDSQRGNKNFFFIGTTNRINKLPKPCKSRFLLDSITFPLVEDFKVKNKFIRKYLTTDNIVLDQEVTDDFLNTELKKTGFCSGRDLEIISRTICGVSKINESTQSSVTVIKRSAITDVMNEYIKAKKDIGYDVKDETDEERQNRHHRENMAMQERHFVQQYMMQEILSDYGDLYISTSGKKKLKSLLSDEQKQTYKNMMKKTNARKAREAAKKAAAEKAEREAKAAKGWSFWK